MSPDEFSKLHPAFRKLSKETLDATWKIIDKWAQPDTFTTTLGHWLNNFGKDNIQLALKILANLDYYTEERFTTELDRRLDVLKRKEIHLTGKVCNAVFVVPDDIADSATRHAWLLSKLEKRSGNKILTVTEILSQPNNDKYLICFNDTYGTGNQFVNKHIWNHLKGKINPKQIVVLGMVIAEEAHKRFEELGFIVIPEIVALNVNDAFSKAEVSKLEALGQKINPVHPLGYENTGLLVAYSFQCPNNTISLIWSERDRESDFPWSKLFTYHGKTRETEKFNHSVANGDSAIDVVVNTRSVSSKVTDAREVVTHAKVDAEGNGAIVAPLVQRGSLSNKDLRNIMCFHQGKILEFFFMTAVRHKALRLAREAKGTGRKEKIRKAEVRLREYIAVELEAIYFDSFKRILDCYFKGRRPTLPRICVKSYMDLHLKEPSIQAMARSTLPFAEPKTTIHNNTGFYRVEIDRKAYLCNDIVKDVIAKKYLHNPRLNISSILKDVPLIGEDNIRGRWTSYWDKGQADETMCYQSTLIVPLTLINNSLSNEFKKEFGIDNFEKTIFGFLCFDHIEKDFFLQHEDEDIGYFMADILSLYQVVALGFTSASETYKKSIKLLFGN